MDEEGKPSTGEPDARRPSAGPVDEEAASQDRIRHGEETADLKAAVEEGASPGEPSPHLKPSLTVKQQIEHLKSQGVTFELCSEEEALRYLATANDYLRTRSYRKLYPRQLEGEHRGQYVNLDFGSLVALSSLDRQLREAFLAISVDVEHFAKMKVLNLAQNRGEDGYEIVASFKGSLTRKQRKALTSTLDRRSQGDAYAGGLISHYQGDMPLWVFVEVIDFGMFLTLYKFCAERWADRTMEQEHYVLKGVKSLRNATAHNHCTVNGLTASAESPSYETNELITASLNDAGLGRTKSRRSKLANLRVAQMAATLYASNALCERPATRRRHAELMQALRERYQELVSVIRPTNALASYFDFLWKLVDIWAPIG